MGDFKKLRVWQEARGLATGVFVAAAKFEGTTAHVFRNQICRAALSIPANIAEGSAKSGDREFARFLKIARGSLAELESHLIIACDVGVISQQTQQALAARLGDVSRMLNGFLDTVLLSAETTERAKRRKGGRRAVRS
jgi:four helix bundle protein